MAQEGDSFLTEMGFGLQCVYQLEIKAKELLQVQLEMTMDGHDDRCYIWRTEKKAKNNIQL